MNFSNYQIVNPLEKKPVLGNAIYLGDIELHAPEWIIDKKIPCGVGVIAGSPGVGKTTAIIPLALNVCGFSSHLDYHIQSSVLRKLVVFTEDSAQITRILYGVKKHMVRKDSAPVTAESINEWVKIYPSKRLASEDLSERITEAVNEHSYEHEKWGLITPLVILDTSSANMDMKEENNNSQVSDHMSKFKEIYERIDVSIWVSAHLAKTGKGLSIDELANFSARGGGAWEGDANFTIIVGRDPAEQKTIMRIDKERVGHLSGSELHFKLVFHAEKIANRIGFDEDVWYPVIGITSGSKAERFKASEDAKREANIEAIKEGMKDSLENPAEGFDGYFTMNDLLGMFPGNKESKRGFIKSLIADGILIRFDNPSKTKNRRDVLMFSDDSGAPYCGKENSLDIQNF
ncbi:AAA family ATPase [Polynucleobacter sp. MWH-UH23A]|uniref:AAA family ATPase n=1 Tax=Polynucleobacter sp. MWH-UH23A TaxID=1855613 RepID=UPI003364DD41